METLAMSRKERGRLEIFGRVKRGELSLVKAAQLLGLSYRQAKRLQRRFREAGDKGLVHGLRGRASNRRGPAREQRRILNLYRRKYADFGPTLAAEYLASEDQQRVAVSTLRRWLVQAGLWQARRRGVRHRRWRPRKEHFGEMVQMDGSVHDWFEGRRGKAWLMVMIDDATNHCHAQFFEAETTAAAMTVFRRYVEQYGLPRSLYVDRDSIYEATRDATTDEELQEIGAETQFGRAMRELDVRLILAHSPQAKGRVERRNGLLQDRLVKALRLAKIDTLEAANRFLEAKFLPQLNRRFRVEPAASADLHRRVPRGVKLDEVLSLRESRVVQNDWCVQWRNRWFQLAARHQGLALARKRIDVCEQLDGTLRLVYRGHALQWQELPERPRPALVQPAAGPKRVGHVGQIPAQDHLWRQAINPSPRTARRSCSASVATLPARSKTGGKQSIPT